MKNKCFVFMLSIFSFCSTHAQEQPKEECATDNTATLKVNFSTNQVKGVLYIAVFNKKEDYLKKRYKQHKLEMLDGKNKQLLIEGLCLHKDYSISAFLDENDNASLDKNFLGIPKESYAFSNNVKGMFGPPNYEKTKITLDEDQKTISILVK